MSNKVKIIYENLDGIELAQWLGKETNRRMLDNKRILYVVRANIDNSLIKFGIGGVEHGGTSAFGRLLQYINYYGEAGEFDCKGIKLFLGKLNIRFKLNIGFAFIIIKKTPASFFKQLVNFYSGCCFIF